MLRLALALALVIACAACGEPSPPAASNTASPTTSTTAVHPPAEFVGGPVPTDAATRGPVDGGAMR
jgi:ABC-type glycerol-3-phosphate transport system substrate-binding protein